MQNDVMLPSGLRSAVFVSSRAYRESRSRDQRPAIAENDQQLRPRILPFELAAACADSRAQPRIV
jgi:hypothetical protein